MFLFVCIWGQFGTLVSSVLLMYELHLRDETICRFCGSDFDECSVYGTCSQSCTNTDGGYTCSCVEGYLPQPDNRSCKAKNGTYLQASAGSSLLLTFSRLRYTSVPVDRLPVLLIANSQNIQVTSLSGTTVHSLLSTTTKQTTAMDFLYAEETVCWIHVGDTPSSTHLKCARIPNLKSFTEERIINISLSLHRECNNGRMKGWRGRP